MLLTPHILVGAAVGVATGNPVLGFAGGLVSHYLLDTVPHTDPGTLHLNEPAPYRATSIDITIGISDIIIASSILLLLAGRSPIVGLSPALGILGGVVPDVVGVAPIFFPRLYTLKGLNKYYQWTAKYHKTSQPNRWIVGVVTQLIVIGLAVWYLLVS